jgi:hypothetical protein
MKRKPQPKPEPPPDTCSWCHLGPADEHVRARGIHEECQQLEAMREEQAEAMRKRRLHGEPDT